MTLLTPSIVFSLYILTQLSLTYATHLPSDHTLTLSSVPVTTLSPVQNPISSASASTTFPIPDPPPTQQPLEPVAVEEHIELPQLPLQAPIQLGTPAFLYNPYPIAAASSPNLGSHIHPLSIPILILVLIGILCTLNALPFALMPSDPRAASSSSASKPSSSSSSSAKQDPRAAAASSSKDPRASSSSSGGGSSSSSGGGSSSSSSAKPPPQPTPFISANAWMSFFLFCCLVLIILQGPLGLSGETGALPSLPGFRGGANMGGLPGCTGMVAGVVPWCQAVVPAAPVFQPMNPMGSVIVEAATPPPIQVSVPQMGGQGMIAGPNGAGGYSWYANPQPQAQQRQSLTYRASDTADPISVLSRVYSSSDPSRQCTVSASRTASASRPRRCFQHRYALRILS